MSQNPKKTQIPQDSPIDDLFAEPSNEPLYIMNNDSIGSVNDNSLLMIKGEESPFSEIEQGFIENMLSGLFSDQNSALKAAGYPKASNQAVYAAGCRILEKFISHTGNTAKIFRMMGINEVRAGRGLILLAEGARSEGARISAWNIICKILSMIKDNTEINQGDIILNVFKQEITRRYVVTQINVNSPPDHTDNTQKRYELPPPPKDSEEPSE